MCLVAVESAYWWGVFSGGRLGRAALQRAADCRDRPYGEPINQAAAIEKTKLNKLEVDVLEVLYSARWWCACSASSPKQTSRLRIVQRRHVRMSRMGNGCPTSGNMMKHAAIGALLMLMLMMSAVHARDTAKEPWEEAERQRDASEYCLK